MVNKEQISKFLRMNAGVGLWTLSLRIIVLCISFPLTWLSWLFREVSNPFLIDAVFITSIIVLVLAILQGHTIYNRSVEK